MRVSASNADRFDFCRIHRISEATAVKRYGNVGDGPDGRGNCFDYDEEHPDYETGGIVCAVCGRELTDADQREDA